MTEVRSGGVAVFVNPRSRANKRNPKLASEFAAALGDAGRVLAPASLDDLAAIARELPDERPDVIAVHGGDGTLHKVVTALGDAFGDAPLPPIAVLAGGTMNVVATSLRIRHEPRAFLRELAEDTRAGRPLDLLPRRCMRLDDGAKTHLGFVFGNGLAANFLGVYYADDAYGPRRAAWMILHTALSGLIDGPFVKRIFRRFEGEVRVDGELLPMTRFVGVNAATVREVGLGFKLNHRADDDPERFGVLAIHSRPMALIADFAAVHAGRGVSPKRAFSAVASSLEIAPLPTPFGAPLSEMSYTIDGDLYRVPATARLRISVGPRIRFVRPRGLAGAQSPVLAAVRAVPQLPSPAAEATMDAAR
ncbi:MAG TPA: diacylglycerol kinase family protein [Polyangia bacterium]|nr:diacylglycerol kinase family protein [Polyangia bacterium]